MGEQLTDAQELHLSTIKLIFETMVDKKYRIGQNEHGGDLFQMDSLKLLDNAIEECIDQFTYLITLRNQLVRKIKK